ncbi:MAG TPA: hypothetical protein DCS48_04565 [Desulfovibrio sp.]|nr:hypothetical protein [Desulfovibrio sp.]
MSQKVEKSIQDLVMNGPVSLDELAERLGKNPKTLAREVNPEDKKAKLGAETLVEIMRITGAVEPLRLMAEELDLTIESLD